MRMPFEIEYAEREPERMVILGAFFDFVEESGIRVVVGWAVGWWLVLLRAVFGVFFDLRHLRQDE